MGSFIVVNGSSYHLLNVYAPSNGVERALFFQKLKKTINDLDKSIPIIMAGDFNCTLNTDLDRNSVFEPHPPSAQLLRNTITHFKLVDTWRRFHGNAKNYTWHRVCRGWILYILLNR